MQKPLVNFYSHKLEDGIAVLAQEVFNERGELVDVELWPPYNGMDEAACQQQAVLRNRLAVQNGDHISLEFGAQQKAQVA